MCCDFIPFPISSVIKRKRKSVCCCPTSKMKVEWDGLISSFLSSRDRPFWINVLDQVCRTVCVYLFLLKFFWYIVTSSHFPFPYYQKKKDFLSSFFFFRSDFICYDLRGQFTNLIKVHNMQITNLITNLKGKKKNSKNNLK
jgi:hypothetical protein